MTGPYFPHNNLAFLPQPENGDYDAVYVRDFAEDVSLWIFNNMKMKDEVIRNRSFVN